MTTSTTTSETDTRGRILDAAGPIFASRGYEGASLREIAGAASVNVASIAYYFDDKMGLYRHVIDQIRKSRDEQVTMPGDMDNMSPRDRLAVLVRTVLERMLSCNRSGWESQLMMREMMQPTAVFKDLVNESFRPLFNALKHTLSQLVDRPVEPHIIEQLALSVIGQCLYYRVGDRVVEILIPETRRKKHFDLDTLSQHITSVTLASVNDPECLGDRKE